MRLKGLEANWDKSGGSAIEPEAISHTFEALCGFFLLPDTIFPSPDGGVDLNWNHTGLHCTVFADRIEYYIHHTAADSNMCMCTRKCVCISGDTLRVTLGRILWAMRHSCATMMRSELAVLGDQAVCEQDGETCYLSISEPK